MTTLHAHTITSFKCSLCEASPLRKKYDNGYGRQVFVAKAHGDGGPAEPSWLLVTSGSREKWVKNKLLDAFLRNVCYE